MSDQFSSPPGGGSSSGDSDLRGAPDPVSWLQIEQGWNVVTSDGVAVGTVAQIEGDKSDDIFDGIAVEDGTQTRYVPGEVVDQIFPGRVTLKMGSADLDTLQPFQPAPPETKWVPGKPSLSTRLSRWLRGRQ